jgi:hypothetical protein
MNDNILSQLQQATSETQKTWIITEALLQTLPAPLAEAVLAAAIPHWFDAAILAALLQIEPVEAEQYYQGLQELSFTEVFGDLGYALHDLTRAGILAHLIATEPDPFKVYSQRAYEYFHQFDDAQHAVEAIYHLLAVDKADGMDKFKAQMKSYRREANFSAANNLIRNANELASLGLLVEEAAEIEHQDFLNVEKLIQLGKREAKPEYLTEAIKFLNPAEDLDRYEQVGLIQLHDVASNLKRSFLAQKLDEAQQLGDKFRQIVW